MFEELIPVIVTNNKISRQIEINPELVYRKRLPNGAPVVVVAGEALRDILSQSQTDALANNIALMTRQLPNVLLQTTDGQSQQIVDGNSLALFTEQHGNLVPARYLTLYPYETIPNASEYGTLVSFPLSKDQFNFYSDEKSVQRNLPGAGTESHRGLARLAQHQEVIAIGTTTGIPALIASIHAGFIPAPRSFVNTITGNQDSWAEVCQPCDPSKKTFADTEDVVRNESCRRCFDHSLRKLETQAKLEETLESLPQTTDTYPSPCVFSYYIPFTHKHYLRLQPLLTQNQIRPEVIDQLMELRSRPNIKFI